MYSYLRNVYCDGTAASLLAGRNAEAEYIVLLLGSFLRAVQYGTASCFSFDQIRSACAVREALLRVPRVLVGQWFRFGIFGILEDMNVNPVLALLAAAPAAEVDCNAGPDLVWFSYTFGERMIFLCFTSAPLR